MNKSDLINAIAEGADIPKASAAKALDAFLSTVTTELSTGGEVQLVGFGSFKVTERAARSGRNPQTGGTIQIPSAKVPKLSFAKIVKESVNN